MLKMFVFIDTWFVKQDIQKWLKTQICSFLWRIWKLMNRKRTKQNLTFRNEDSNPRFSVIFLPMIWIFMKGRVTRSNQNNLLKEIGLYLYFAHIYPETSILSLISIFPQGSYRQSLFHSELTFLVVFSIAFVLTCISVIVHYLNRVSIKEVCMY